MSRTVITRAHAAALLFGGAAFYSTTSSGRAQSNAPVNVMALVAVKAALDGIVPLFQKTSGRKIAIQYDSGANIARRITSGEAFDVVVTGVAALNDFTKAGLVAADSQSMIGTTVASLAYRRGASRPDISTPDALKAVVLNAKSISFSDPALGGASSVYFAGIIEHLGISDDVQRKATLTKPGEGAFPVGNGQAEIGVAQASEIAMVPGVDGVPIFPSDPKSKSSYAAGISSKSTQADAARAFVRFLLSPEATAIRKAKGLAAD
jgi:molybdate transport system substrate-binding protein